MDQPTLSRIVELPLNALLECVLHGGLSLREELYAQVLIAYHQGNLEELDRLRDKITRLDFSDRETLLALLQARRDVRAHQASVKTIAPLLQVEAPEWKGEARFIAALAHAPLKNPKQARALFLDAEHAFLQSGSPKKALKSAFNAVVAETQIDPESKSLVTDYSRLAKRALELQETSVAGQAFQNISRELQKLGALRVALTFIHQAIECLEPEAGSLNLFHALAHRAHVLLDSGLSEEAQLDYERCAAAEFKEIRSALAVLDVLQGKVERFPDELRTALTSTWSERLNFFEGKATPPAKIGDLENTLLAELASGPKTKEELIAVLYGTTLSEDVLENRFKNLLNRVRTRLPELIVLEDGAYRWIDR